MCILLVAEMLMNINMSRAINNGGIDFNKVSLMTITFCTAQDLFYLLKFIIYMIT